MPKIIEKGELVRKPKQRVMAPKYKPCPFCGAKDGLTEYTELRGTYVVCEDGCGASGPDPDNGDWNMRAPQEAKIERLRAALTALVDEYSDYQIINNLGDPEKEHKIKRAGIERARAELGEGE